MKPQFHPSADDITIESILHALSDPGGVQIFAAISQSECAALRGILSGIERSQGAEVDAFPALQDPSRTGPPKE